MEAQINKDARFTIGPAVMYMRMGHKVARAGWNGTSAWDRAEDAADLSLWGKVLLVAAMLALGLGGTFLVLWVCP